MLELTVSTPELFDESTSEFVPSVSKMVQLEHSLVSVSKWESRFKKPFLSDTPRTNEETLWYIRCMLLTPDVPEIILNSFGKHEYDRIEEYINDSMTATWFSEHVPPGRSREVITSELIYYWMIALGVPPEYQYWHLNRLLTLVKICNVKNQPAKKMNRRDAAAQQRALNARRRAELNSRG